MKEPLRILRASASRLGPEGGASYYILDGWARAVRAVGWHMRMWDGTDPEVTLNRFALTSTWRMFASGTACPASCDGVKSGSS